MTEFEFTLHPVGTQALLVDLFYPPDQVPRPLRRWRDLIAEAPRQATLTAWAGPTGQWPFLPAELWGRPLTSVGYVWVGDPDHGRSLPELSGRGIRVLARDQDGTVHPARWCRPTPIQPAQRMPLLGWT